MGDLSLEKPIPCNLEAERSVLGAVLLDDSGKAILTISENFGPRDFHLDSHGKIFQAMLDLMNSGRPIDLITLKEELQRRKQLEAIGGAAYLAGLTEGLPRAMNVSFYTEIVRQKSSLRRLIRIANETMARCYEAEESPARILETTEERLFQLAAREIKKGFQSAGELTDSVFKEIEEASRRQSVVTGLGTGFTDLDRMTGGMCPGDLIVVAARPGLGKTAFCLNVAANVAIRKKKVSGFFSLEMTKGSLLKRMISAESGVAANRIKCGYLTKDDWAKLTRATGEIHEAPIYLDDESNLSILQVRAKALRLTLEHGLDLLVIDYLQLLSGSGRRHESRAQEVTEISRGLKNLAKELNIPIIAVSQLNREIEKRSSSRTPQLSDLRESGAIEQDADIILFLSREDLLNPSADHDRAEVIIAKQRNGATGRFTLAFDGLFTKFRDCDG